MKKLLPFWILLCLLLINNRADAQFHTGRSRSELGFLVGGSYYMGDLNPVMPFRNTHLAGGLIFRYNVHARMAVRANLTYGNLSGDDAQSDELMFQDRNLSFHTDIYEFATGVEFNYFPFQLGHDRYKGTAYLLAEIGMFRMNPKTYADDGSEIELQPLGTEGQGTSLNSKKQYSLTQLCIPFGLGCKISMGKRASLNFEFGLRKTFTDYIDDVGKSSYVDPVQLAIESGPLVASLSNRSLSGSRYGRRGDASTKDWYVFSGIMIMIRLGQPSICW